MLVQVAAVSNCELSCCYNYMLGSAVVIEEHLYHLRLILGLVLGELLSVIQFYARWPQRWYM